MPFYRSTAPTGWLICDGSAIPAQFTSLIALVGANTPNLRGTFIRGWSPGTSTTSQDPLSASRTLGNVQSDEFRSHDHGGITGNDSPDHSHQYTRPLSVGDNDRGGSSSVWSIDNNQTVSTGGASVRHQHSISSQGGLETRPVNIALLYCIKT
jgi:microcystin-dependent protein